jgi:CRP/FNR family transcriptional regulator
VLLQSRRAIPEGPVPFSSGGEGGGAPAGSPLGRRLAEVAVPKRLQRGDFFVHEGDPPDVLGVVLSGRVKVVTHAASGRDVILHVLGPGQVFGVVPVLDRRPYPASVIAVDDVEIGRVDATGFEGLLRRDPDLALSLLRTFAGRLRGLSAVMGVANTGDAGSRLAARLLDQAGAGTVAAITRQELADLAGTTVETAIRATRAWEREGVLRLSRGRIEIRDRRALGIRAGQE